MPHFGMVRLLVICLALAQAAVAGVPLRVVTFNIEAGFVGSERQPSIAERGSIDYESVRAILARIDADVVCLQEVFPDTDNNENFFNLAEDLGYEHALLSTRSNSFDFQLRNAVLSRYPFVSVQEIGSAGYNDEFGIVGSDGNRARDVTRTMPAIVIDVPGTTQPTTIITLHNKSGGEASDLFRRAIELARVRDYLDRNDLNGSDNLIVTGDFNISTNFSPSFRAFVSEPSGLPATFNRGSDVPFPINYSNDVDFYFPAPFNLVALDARAVNGDAATFQRGGSTLDYLMSSPAITVLGSEVYRSELDGPNPIGLPKSGAPLASNTSELASDHWAVFADFDLVGTVPRATSYSLTDATLVIEEGFDGFGGGRAPLPWASSDSNWRGFFFNQSEAANYAFDTDGNRSVGALTSPTPSIFSATFDNDSTATIEELDLSLLARQLTSHSPGTDDTLTATLRVGDGPPLNLPELTFVATAGAPLPLAETLATTVAGLAILPGESFTLSLTATQGQRSGGPVSSQVFINEFHYDNSGTDSGEFVEVVVAPGFEAAGGRLTDVVIELYNGSSTTLNTYDSIQLSDFDNFANPTVRNGYRIYTTEEGLQNGPDGIAIVINGTVTQFISYEGTFTPVEDSAIGMESVDVGVEQSPAFAAGVGSIGLIGEGIDSTELAWTRFGEDVRHTPGELNPGQTFTGGVPQLAQAISFDDVRVAIVVQTDSDQDGIPDSSDPDDDDDLLPDLLEVALGTNPLAVDSDGNGVRDGDEDSDGDGLSNLTELLITATDATDRNSRFVARIMNGAAGSKSLSLTFPTLEGRNYRILSGMRPDELSLLLTLVGSGSPREFVIDASGNPLGFYAVEVVLAAE